MARVATCRYHCRPCGAHFTSLAAFDAHREGPMDARHCEIPDDLVERDGNCGIVYDPPKVGVTLYEHPSAALARTHFQAEKPSSASHKRETVG